MACSELAASPIAVPRPQAALPLFGGATNGNNYTPYFPGGFPPGPPLTGSN